MTFLKTKLYGVKLEKCMKKKQVNRTIIKIFIVFSVIFSSQIFSYDSIIVYGRENCGLTKRFRNQLNAERIRYTFYDVDIYANKSQEMFNKVDRFYPGVDTVKFPVVDVNGTVLISPNVPTFKKYLNTRVTQNNSYNQNNYYNNQNRYNQNQNNNTIQVYGRENCGLTQYFLKQLQANGANYAFYDVDKDYSRNNEMFSKVYRKYPDIGTFKFPVVDVRGNILLSPNFNQFKSVYLPKSNQKPTQVARPQIKPVQQPPKKVEPQRSRYATNNSIILYGRETCGLTQDFRRQLDAIQAKYTFYDVDLNPNRQNEMFNKVNYYYPGMEMITFPVIDVNGRLLISPNFNDFTRYLRLRPLQSSNFPALNPNPNPSTVLVYGSETCGLTNNFRQKLEEEQTNYVFFDVEKDTNKQDEMFTKVNTFYPDLAVIMYPVVDVNGSILVSPNISEFKKIYKQ